MNKYPYLKDSLFLQIFDRMRIKEQTIKIVVLDKQERALQTVEGRVTTGNISINGDSAVRRTANITVAIPESEAISYKNVNDLFYIGRKIKIEIGFMNMTGLYLNYGYIWFPLGTYGITNLSVSHTLTDLSVSFTLHDKMCFLNGECGGVIPAAIDKYSEVDVYDDNGMIVTEKAPIYQMIKELVAEFGGEAESRIFIDLQEASNILMWNGSEPLVVGGEDISGIESDPLDIADAAYGEYVENTIYKDGNSYYAYYEDEGLVKLFEDITVMYCSSVDKIEKLFNGDLAVYYYVPKDGIYEYVLKAEEDDEKSFFKRFFIEEDNFDENFQDGDLFSIRISNMDGDYIYPFKYSFNSVGMIGTAPTALTWPDGDDFVLNAGDTITSALDRIKSTLGNYEYYYDVNGNFIFQEVKNYLNTAKSYTDWKKLISNDNNKFLIKKTSDSVYTFDDATLVSSYSNAPQITSIKNDFIVWGLKKNASGFNEVIRYHLAIDDKPEIGKTHTQIKYVDEDGLTRLIAPVYIATEAELMEITGTEDNFYYTEDTNAIYQWNPEVETFEMLYQLSTLVYYKSLKDITNPKGFENGDYTYYYIPFDGIYIYEDYQNSFFEIFATENDKILEDVENGDEISLGLDYVPFSKTDLKLVEYTSADWRTELYLRGNENYYNGTDKGIYYEELKTEWPTIYDLENEKFYDYVEQDPSSVKYFLDFIDAQHSALNNISVSNIGRRSKIVNDEKINCVFEPEIPEFIVEVGEENKVYLNEDGHAHLQLTEDNFAQTAIAPTYNSAYEYAKDLLYQSISYNESINLNTIPIYYLEPNTRITVKDDVSSIYGDYVIKSISLPLTIGGTMSISANRCLDKI